MGDNYLTERECIELVDKLINKKLNNIMADIQELKGFQRHESNTIEYELQRVLHMYLKKVYKNNTIREFPMKRMYDPYTNKEITEFDAAFLLEPYIYKPNYTRIKEAKIPYPSKNIVTDISNIFVLAEAKHYINYNKIKTKLWQFDQVRHIFSLAKQVKSLKELEVTPKFIMTIERNKFLQNIDKSILIFGAAYWEPGLLSKFQNDLNTRENMIINFFKINDITKKKEIYIEICNIESKWYDPENVPNNYNLSIDEINNITYINGAMNYVKIIVPSCNRYNVLEKNNSESINYFGLLKGGNYNKTVKRRS